MGRLTREQRTELTIFPSQIGLRPHPPPKKEREAAM